MKIIDKEVLFDENVCPVLRVVIEFPLQISELNLTSEKFADSFVEALNDYDQSLDFEEYK